ncbi:hypothetical protein TrLO_g1218 [Triparma laevis f. longispina]|uniref:Uncharacterized protein n=1 Tax=Triparma laevis f. longispina TaxID=1714387 RepID=A0A9W7L0U7_9STRA|nr:hypothetical protein TrLO_g1218 [Triparma laevis f. longispina]
MLRLSRLSSGESEEMRDGAGGVGGGSGSMKSVERGVSGVSEFNSEGEEEVEERNDVFVFKAKVNSNATQPSSTGGGIDLGLGVGGMAGVGGVAGVRKASLPKLIPPKLPNVSTDLKFDSKSSSYLTTTFKTGLPILIPPDLPSVSGSALDLDDVSRRYLNGVNGEEVEDLKQRVKDLETQVQLLLQHSVRTGAIRGVDEQALVDEMVVDNAANNEQYGGENAPPAAAAEQQPAWMNFPILPLLKYLGLCTLLTLRESSKPIPLYLKVLKSVTFLVIAIATWYAQNFSRAVEAGEDRWAFLRVGRDGGRFGDVVWFFGSLCFR